MTRKIHFGFVIPAILLLVLGLMQLRLDSTTTSNLTHPATLITPNRTRHDNFSVAVPPAPGDLPATGLWMVVESFNEGISAWLQTIVQLALLAKHFNATLVEPNIQNGRLISPGIGGNIRLFDVLDQKALRKIHPKWATHQDYARLVALDPASKVFDWCIAKANHPNCKYIGGNFDQNQLRNSTVLHQAVAALQHHERVILRMDGLWINSFENLKFREGYVVPAEAKWLAVNTIDFSPQMHVLANQTLRLMNIEENDIFSVIHWRAELDNIDYLKCAGYISQAQSIMQKDMETRNYTSKFLLMSSLSSDESHIWGGAKEKARNSSATQALDRLMRVHSFAMSSEILPPQKDLVVYSAVDLILAERAMSFATCSNKCKRSRVCKECNYFGRFAGLALVSRSRDKAKKIGTYKCWPES
jgi:hypothetical protein